MRIKKESISFCKSKKLFFDCIAMHKFVWFKEILFESKKLFSGCSFVYICFLLIYDENTKTINKFLWIKETFLLPYSNAQICLNQGNFFLGVALCIYIYIFMCVYNILHADKGLFFSKFIWIFIATCTSPHECKILRNWHSFSVTFFSRKLAWKESFNKCMASLGCQVASLNLFLTNPRYDWLNTASGMAWRPSVL